MVYLAWCLEGLAGVAAAEGDLGRAAEIAGGREALRAQTGVLLPPVYPAAWERMLATVRDGLGEAGFDEAYGRLVNRPPPDIIAASVGGSLGDAVNGESPAGPRGGSPAGPAGAVPAGREGSNPAGWEGATPAGP
jgi:hypothetical protein